MYDIDVHIYVGLAITETISEFNECLNSIILTIMWTPATNQFCEVLYYLVMLYSNEYSSVMNVSGLSMRTVFTDLADHALYNITVTAFNEAGNLSDTELSVRVSLNTTKGLFLYLGGFIYIHYCSLLK